MWDQFIHSINSNLNGLGKNLGDWFGSHLFNILIITLGAWVLRHFGAKIINETLRHTMRTDMYPSQSDREKRLKTLNSLVSATMRIAVTIVATIMIVSELGINTGPLLASASILGVALGFGAQSLIKDFVNGIFIIIENQYRVGDIVSLGTVSGVVEAITIRTTVLRDLDGHVHHIPNGAISITTNKTMYYGRINENIVVAIETDLDKLAHVINHVGEELAAIPEFHNKISDAPRMTSVKGFYQNGVMVKILGTTTAAEEWKVKSEMYKRLKKAFDSNHIKLAAAPAIVHNVEKKK